MSAEEARRRVAAGEDGTDWARVAATTDEEIDAMIAADPDTAPEADAAWFAAAAHAVAATRVPREKIALAVDRDVLAFFRAGGPGYQTRMHAVLRTYVDHHPRER